MNVDNNSMDVDNNSFNEFLKPSKKKIDIITPKNPIISKNDEWQKETCWDEDTNE